MLTVILSGLRKFDTTTGCHEWMCDVEIPQWMWALLFTCACVALGTGVRLYRTRRAWMRRYRDDQSQH